MEFLSGPLRLRSLWAVFLRLPHLLARMLHPDEALEAAMGNVSLLSLWGHLPGSCCTPGLRPSMDLALAL